MVFTNLGGKNLAGGQIFAKLVDDTETRDLIPIITKRVKSGTRICSDTWRAYTGLATRGYVHRTVEHRKKEYARGKVCLAVQLQKVKS